MDRGKWEIRGEVRKWTDVPLQEDLLDVTTKDHSETTKRHVRVMNISASTIKCLLTVSMLHCGLIIDQKRSLLDQLCLKRTSLDAAERVFIYSNRDFEVRVRSVTTHQNQSSYSRGCNTGDNGTLGTKCIAESVVDIGLASSSRTIKEKALARVSVYKHA
jgi:hypothetical protein